MNERVPSEGLDIEALVGEATWKDILMGLVRKNELNPWDIDIVDIVDKYVAAVRELKVLDLHVPANIILAAAMLLRFKSEVLLIAEEEDATSEEPHQRQKVAVEQLTLRLRLPPKRRLTLAELIGALDEAMKLKEVRDLAKKNLQVQFPMMINEIDIEAEVERIYQIICKLVDKSKMVTFSSVCRTSQFTDVLLDLFIPLLFLAHKEKVTLIQEKFFDEIIIALN
jgi:segregation and condensation protein A